MAASVFENLRNKFFSGSGAGTAADPIIPVVQIGGASAAASSGATTVVPSSATAVTLLAANAARKSAVISNDSTAILYILLGAGTVSSSNYTYAVAAKATVAASVTTPAGFTGIITGLWATANGNALVTELT